MPNVSVIIPTYNRRDFLPEAMASCFEENDALDIEVVVVDDGSTDGTRKWLKNLEDPRVRPVFQKHQGAQQARNAGLRVAEGETIKFLDSDDRLYPGTLQQQHEALKTTGADVCYGPIDIVDENGRVTDHKSNPVVEDLLAGVARGDVTTYPHVFLYRAEVARRNRWRPEVPFHQDTAYALDVAVRNPLSIREDITVGIHRVHGGPRVSTTAKAGSVGKNIRYKAGLLYRAYERRKEIVGLTDAIREDVAVGLWREAHKLAPLDLSSFNRWWLRIQEIAPDFKPPRSNAFLKRADRCLGPKFVEKTINPLRSLKAVSKRYAGIR